MLPEINNMKEALMAMSESTLQASVIASFQDTNIVARKLQGAPPVPNDTGSYIDGGWVDYLLCDVDEIGSGKGCGP